MQDELMDRDPPLVNEENDPDFTALRAQLQSLQRRFQNARLLNSRAFDNVDILRNQVNDYKRKIGEMIQKVKALAGDREEFISLKEDFCVLQRQLQQLQNHLQQHPVAPWYVRLAKTIKRVLKKILNAILSILASIGLIDHFQAEEQEHEHITRLIYEKRSQLQQRRNRLISVSGSRANAIRQIRQFIDEQLPCIRQFIETVQRHLGRRD